MDPLLILLLGMLIVIVAVLKWRLHAFLALVAGAFAVASLTPAAEIFYHEVRDQGVQVLEVDDRSIVSVDDPDSLLLPNRLACVRVDRVTRQYSIVGEFKAVESDGAVRLQAVDATEGKEVAMPQAGDWLLSPSAASAAFQLAGSPSTSRIAFGFGDMCGKIGIVIAMAAIIGRCLLDSGAAERIVSAMQAGLGERNTPAAFSLSGFMIGIPVYFDTVFYLLLPLARAMARRTGRDYLLFVLSIIVGATMAHSLVPPTPGPLLVATELNVSLGMMILAGTTVGLIAVGPGFLFAQWANRRWPLPTPVDDYDETEVDSADRPQPPIWLACMPIVLPVVLLSVGTLLQIDWDGSEASGSAAAPWLVAARSVWMLLGDKHMALGLATVIAMGMLLRYHPPSIDPMRSVQDAIFSAGNIVLITAAGGAFGYVLRQSGIAEAIQQRFPTGQSGVSLLIVAFAITAIIRIAQGSATVAMITSVGIIGPLVQSTTLPFHPVYVALAIGCGSKPIQWMNDSGFWVITRMSGMTEIESLRTVSVVLTIMGVVGLLVTIVGAIWLPLV